MINSVKNLFYKNRVLFENFSFLGILQVSNLLIFVIIVPYLFRVLDKERYGLVIFAQTISTYFSIIVNFGFNVSATRDISMYRDDKSKVTKVISSVLSLKLILFFISILILTSLVLFIPLLNDHPTVFFLSMIFCLGEALFPIWYFQGIEKMKYITFINLATRIFSTLLLFVFVKQPNDYLLVPLFLGIGNITGAFIGLYIVFVIHNNKFIFIYIKNLINCIRNNIPLFISNVSSQIYVNSNKLIVGLYMGMQDVAIYDIADKIVNLLKVPLFLILQTLFPRVSLDKNVFLLKKVMTYVIIIYIIIYFLILIFAGKIIFIFSGMINPVADNLLRLLSFSILPIGVGLFFNELLLVPFGFFRDYTKMRILSLFIYLIFIVFFIIFKQLKIFHLAFVIIIVESFVFLFSFYLCKKNKLI